MTSPDLPQPVDLTLHSVTETQLVNAMIAAFRTSMPEWIPQEGATEIMLMESLALVMGQQIFALNQLPRVVLDGVIALRGFQRKPAVAATGQIAVTLAASTLGTRVLPAGARFRVPLGAGTVDALTLDQATINPSDSLTAVVNVVAAQPGSVANGISPGSKAVMVDTFTWIESALVSQAFTGGVDLEADGAFYQRVAAAFAAQATTLVTAAQYATAALDVPGVGRAKATSLWDGVGAVGGSPGHVTVAVAAADGSNVASTVKAKVLETLTANAVAGMTVHVVDFTRITMNLAVQYTPVAGYNAALVASQIEQTLRAWLNPATWPYSETLTSVNQIILRIGQVPGVDNIISISGWSPISGTGNTLPVLGTVTITNT